MRSIKKTALMIFSLSVLILIFTSLATSSALGEDNTVTLKIQVKTEDREPLKEAIVKLINATSKQVLTTDKTGNDGVVEFQAAKNQEYIIAVEYPEGYPVGSTSISIKEEGVTETIFVKVLSNWVIKVQSKSEKKDPVPDANVTIVFEQGGKVIYRESKLTDSNGEVKFGPLPRETYVVTVKWGDVKRSENKFPELEGGEVKPYVIELPLYRVELTIIDRKDSPVEGVTIELRKGSATVASTISDINGKATLKLIPNGDYNLTAKLKGIIVYQSSDEIIKVLNRDVSGEAGVVIIDAIRLNITVMDYDGEDVLKNYTLIGKLIKDGREVGSAGSENGVLYFGHTPFENYTLRIMLGSLTVYSGAYEVKVESAEGAVKAWFYDIKIRVNASALVNASLTRSLLGELRAPELRFEFLTADWEASVKNVPKSDNYEASLFYSGREIFRARGLRITSDNQILWLNLTGYRLNVTTINLDEKPVSANVTVLLEGIGTITSFKTDEAGCGSPGRLLPLTYKLEAYVDEMPVGWETVDLSSDKSIMMKLSLKNIYFRILDKDGEESLGNTSLTLMRGKFSKSSKYVGNGTLLVENLPIAEYKLVVTYYGFKVLEDFVKISPEDRLLELKAPGVLDLELIFLDSDKKPLDQGRAIISFGEYEFGSDIGEDGRAIFRNLPNITLSIKIFYKNVKIRIEPSEIDLIRDNMKATIACSVHSLDAEIFRGDGKPLNEGIAVLYVDNTLLKTYNLAEKNSISEKLPEGDIKIEIKYRRRDAGLFSTYLEKSIVGLAIYSSVYPVEIFVRNPDGSAVSGAKLLVEDEMGVIAEAVSGDDGILRLLLPAAENYNVTMKIGNETYNFRLGVEKSKSVSFLRPAPLSMGFELTIVASAINLAISGYAISRIPYGRQQPRREPRRARRVPRI